jgi:hypothetical protein
MENKQLLSFYLLDLVWTLSEKHRFYPYNGVTQQL